MENFYKNLYVNNLMIIESIDILLSDILKDYFVFKLFDNERKLIEGYIIYKEVFLVLNSMLNNKSLGSDGFIVEFLKMFWNKLGFFVVRFLNYGFKVGELLFI